MVRNFSSITERRRGTGSFINLSMRHVSIFLYIVQTKIHQHSSKWKASQCCNALSDGVIIFQNLDPQSFVMFFSSKNFDDKSSAAIQKFFRCSFLNLDNTQASQSFLIKTKPILSQKSTRQCKHHTLDKTSQSLSRQKNFSWTSRLIEEKLQSLIHNSISMET